MARNEQWLKHELMKALGWDDFVVEGVVDVISKAKSAEEVQDIVNVRLMPCLRLQGCTWPSLLLLLVICNSCPCCAWLHSS